MPIHSYECEKCHKNFELNSTIRKGRLVRCSSCKRTTSDKAISSRTWSKILKRLNAKCSICSWDEASLDIHHIIERKNGGTDDQDNLIVLCPNCHRKVHCGLISNDILKQQTLGIQYPNWKKYYKI